MSKEAMKLALDALEETRNALAWFYDSYPQDVTKKGNELLPHVETVLTALREALAEQDTNKQQQEPVERGGLRFYTNGIERQHWKADGSIDFKDKRGNVTMTIAAGSITSSQPSKPLTDEEIWKFWWSRPEVLDGKDDSMEAEFVAAVRRILAAYCIKENT